MSKLLATVFFILLFAVFFFVRAYLKTKPDLTPNAAIVQEQLLRECAPLGRISDKEVIECEKRVRGN